MFAWRHPAIDPGIRAPMILQTVLGFDAATIASAFLVSPGTMGQRLVRAKSKSGRPGIRFGCPSAPICASVWGPCSPPSTRPSRRAGRIRPAPSSAAAISPRRESGSGRLVASLLPEEPRHSACWP